jgi:hypothetical protein
MTDAIRFIPNHPFHGFGLAKDHFGKSLAQSAMMIYMGVAEIFWYAHS